MRRTGCTLGRAFSHAFVFSLLLAAPVYANDGVVAADFDGDGYGDQVTVSSEQPTLLLVWLSATRTTEFVRSAEPLLRVAAADLDGDHRAELIASNRSPVLQIWTKRQKHFRTYRPTTPLIPPGVGRTTDHTSATQSAPQSPTTSTPRHVGGSLVPTTYLGAPICSDWHLASRVRRVALSSLSSTLLAPRPPPARSA